MKGRIKCLSFSVICTLLFIVLLCFPTYAAEYGRQYPDYLAQSSACFIECETNIGKGSIVIPMDYQQDHIGFNGNSYNLMNLYTGTISGQFVQPNGKTYEIRASSFSTFQYYDGLDWQGRYYDLEIRSILNTNVQFSDMRSDRGNTIYNLSNYEVIDSFSNFMFCILLLILTVVLIFKRL